MARPARYDWRTPGARRVSPKRARISATARERLASMRLSLAEHLLEEWRRGQVLRRIAEMTR